MVAGRRPPRLRGKMMDLSTFKNPEFDREAGRMKEFAWLAMRSLCFERSVMPWYRLRRGILRSFGAQVGSGVVVKPQVKITFPWKLSIGDHSWLGEEAWILNLAPVSIGSHVCISQRAFLCTGSHDWTDPAFALVAKPITIGDHVWICSSVFVAPGVTIGDRSVVTAGSVVTQDLPAGMICSGNPCKPEREREIRSS